MLQAPNPRHYTAEHETLRATVRRFFEKEVAPHVSAWDEAGGFPRDLYRKAAEAGLLQLGFPEAYGGVECDAFHRMILFEERAWGGSGGVASGLFSHTIGAPPIAVAGSEALKARVLPGILAGEQISALAITEPGGGSDVAQLATTARRDGGHYVVNGSKLFITSGMRADWFTVAVRTGGPGAAGVSLLLVPGDTPGLTRSPLQKMGWWASDTAEIGFTDCRVPVENLLGDEGQGFAILMRNFNHERLALAAAACGYAQVCLHDAVAWARERRTFGQPLSERQVIRHRLVDMATRIEATRALLDDLASRLDAGESPAAQIAMAKNFATRTFQFCADAAVQILGGMGFMRGTRVERLYREVKVMMIGGGAEEVMKDLIAKRLGL
ncbi:acyl-CoA dehydrogenase [Alicycliphilus denitrificans]|uniref:Isovaleryl-CoA dehydrogenase n=2 Tax=Alicycliphilus denitrificans TaxID=179636 RepID=F4GDN2_ALIDK|nr:acyl-CoA dehydrogenase family protein [Alicycliphilus denitrificans]ADU97973.1 acyl-CoA dehydrogenase domain-containing protein [Alicycliphilus denitrificans BC]AEB82615.1 Isovaleryl-CoA dehydrogenase [Alicycliphilus denitrificans K601]QKD42307.1 acyl-CoA dehydrogenase [Alicycliphilus denitrificans]GAO25909.1 isovaleryl-CoA dehydrogenase [Alicycliphilus sp. B1]